MERYFRLKKYYALRGYLDKPKSIVKYGFLSEPIPLSDDGFRFLLRCNGVTPMDVEKLNLADYMRLFSFMKRGVIEETNVPVPMLEEQKYRYFNHERRAGAEWAITARCNLDCVHCFNHMADMSEQYTHETSLEEAEIIIQKLVDYGVEGVALFGGEPFFHRNFFELVKMIKDAGLRITRITTNGMFLTEKTFERFEEIGVKPHLKISFDGIGVHDWMRNHNGCEKLVLEGIKRSLERGYHVRASINVNKKTLPVLKDTIYHLYDMGVREISTMRTTRMGRWMETEEKAGESLSITHEEFAELMVELTEEFIPLVREGLNLDFYYLLKLYKDSTSQSILNRKREVLSACSGHCQAICSGLYIGTMGHLLPCTGFEPPLYVRGLVNDDISILKRNPEDIVKNYVGYDLFNISTQEIYDNSESCRSCELWNTCYGGTCRVSALVTDGTYDNRLYCWTRQDFCDRDLATCSVNKGGYRKRIADILDAHPVQS